VMNAAVWCPEHDLHKTIVHPLTEIDPLTQEVRSRQSLTNVDCFDDLCHDLQTSGSRLDGNYAESTTGGDCNEDLTSTNWTRKC
jgi:hypothetical protein